MNKCDDKYGHNVKVFEINKKYFMPKPNLTKIKTNEKERKEEGARKEKNH